MEPHLWFWVIGWILTALVIVGNGIVIYLIITRRKLRTTTNVFVASLAAADFGLGATYMPLAAACDIQSLCVGGLVRYSLVVLFNCSSMTNLCVLTMDRYLAVVKPLRYLIFTNRGKRVLVLTCVAWAIPVLFFLAPYLALELTATGKSHMWLYKFFWVYLSLVQLCVCIALSLATLKILRIARLHVRRKSALLAQLNYNHRSRRIKGQTRSHEAASAGVIAVVVCVFILYYTLNIFETICYTLSYELSFIVMDMVSILMLVNSASNPIAFAIFKKDIKKELRRLWPRRYRSRKRSNAIGSANNTYNTQL